MSAGWKVGDSKWLIKRAVILDQSPNFDKLIAFGIIMIEGENEKCSSGG